MKQPTKFKIEARDDGDWQRLVLSGPMTEDAKALLTPWQTAAKERVVLDFGAVTQVNSCGIRDWSIFLRGLKTGRIVEFDRVTDEVVRTMNMVTNFHFRLRVRSLYRAYGCDHCGHEQMELLAVGKDYEHGTVPTDAQTVKCASCGEATDAFESADEYFQFLAGA